MRATKTSTSVCCHRAGTTATSYTKKCANGHLTCVLHTYVDSANAPHCYRCFDIVDEPDWYEPIRFPGQAAPLVQFKHRAIVVVHALHICGAARHALELLSLLAEHGLQTTVVSIYGGGHWADKFLASCHQLVLCRTADARLDMLEDVIGDHKSVRFVSAHYDPAIDWALRTAPPYVPVYAHFHTEPEFGHFTRSTLLNAGDRATRIYFPSDFTRRAYSSMVANGADFDWWGTKTAIMPNATPAAVVGYRKRTTQLPINAELRIAIISRLDPDKFSTVLFVDTMKALRRMKIDFRAKVAGGGEIMADVKAVVARDVGPGIEFLGFVEDVWKIYGWADVVFLPSLRETMPYVAIESVALGKPVVLPAFGHFKAASGQHPLLRCFDPGDADRAADLIACSTQSTNGHVESMTQSSTFDLASWRRLVASEYKLGQLSDNICRSQDD